MNDAAGDRTGDSVSASDTRLVPVDGLDPVGDALFRQWAQVPADAAEHDLGDASSAWSVEELRELERSRDKRRLGVLALDGDEPLGSAGVVLPLRDNLHLAQGFVVVRPEHRRRGVGSLLLAWLERVARDAGRPSVNLQSEHLVDRPHPAEGFATRHGYDAAQTVVRSDQLLPGDVARLRDLATDTGDYACETSVDGIPDSWLEDRAHLARWMSTDAPLGELDLAEEDWDAARVRELDERHRRMGRRSVETVARHLPSGRLVGFTRIEVPEQTPTLAFQHDTLVLREHRGHGLGLRMKAATALAIGRELPQVRVVRTWNAQENAPMRAVNAELGYAASGVLVEWRRGLEPTT